MGRPLPGDDDRFRVLVHNSSDIITVVGEDGTIVYESPSLQRVLGYKPEDRVGRNIFRDSLVHPEDAGKKRAFLDAAMQTQGATVTGEFRLRHADGSYRHIEAVGTNLLHDPRVGGVVANYRDITERRRVEEQLEAASRAKDQFLAMLSHELRNPLTPVLLAATAALQAPETPPELMATFDMIRQNVELEARLIDDLLDVTRVIRGKMHFDWKTVDAHAMLLRTFDICRSDWQGKKLTMTTDLAATRHHVKADPARLQQVLWNLVKNAIKFTPEGGSIIVRSRNEGGRLVLEVADTGIGIEPGDLGRIFHPFEQAEDPRTRKFGGLGLGLAISRSIAEAHGGTLTAESPGRDQGATFRLALKTVAARKAADRETATDTTRKIQATPELRLLLVEDDPVTLRVMSKLLRGVGHSVTTAHTVAGALQAASADLDLVVSDLGLPDGSGLDLMRQIRQEYGLCGIALTGFGADEDISRSREAGFVAHLTKPIDFPRLEEAIRQASSNAEC